MTPIIPEKIETIKTAAAEMSLISLIFSFLFGSTKSQSFSMEVFSASKPITNPEQSKTNNNSIFEILK